MRTVNIWRLTWTHAAGAFWMPVAHCDAASAPYAIARIAAGDAQGVQLVASSDRPALPDGAARLARHPAVWA